MIYKKYLTEVSFIDGTSEFKSYRGYTKLYTIPNNTNNIVLTLESKELDLSSIEVSIKNRLETKVFFKQNNSELNTFTFYLNSDDMFISNDVLEINYIALNEATSDLYSVDYDNGLLYLATASNITLEVESESYNLLATGKQVEQLKSDEYSVSDDSCTINNYQTTSSYDIVYQTEQTETTNYTTPIISNVKVNYINTSEEESL